MSYTNVNLVRNHFAVESMKNTDSGIHELRLVGTDWVNLPARGIVGGSLFVGAIRKNEPCCEKAILDSSPAVLSGSHIAADSVTVASDMSLGTIYTATVDFNLNAETGEIARLDDGAIVSGNEVMVWYSRYEPYAESEDYSADYQWGRIKRLAGGKIADGQTVRVAYEASGADLEDGLLESVVAEANAIVRSKIDPQGRFGADTVLQTAATYLAVSIACRSTAVLCLGTGTNQNQTSSEWLKLAESFRGDFEALLKSFRPDSARLKPPVRS